MIKITIEPIVFPKLDGISGHIYKTKYYDGNLAIVIGSQGRIGKLSVNITELSFTLRPGEFFVKLYSEGLYINEPCFDSGLFERKLPKFFVGSLYDAPFEKWRLKSEKRGHKY